MIWLEKVNAALSVGAKLLADQRESLGDAREPLELLLRHLDDAVASVAIASSKAKDPPVAEVFNNWDDESYRYSPPDE